MIFNIVRELEVCVKNRDILGMLDTLAKYRSDIALMGAFVPDASWREMEAQISKFTQIFAILEGPTKPVNSRMICGTCEAFGLDGQQCTHIMLG